MQLNTWLKQQAEMAMNKEVCSLPDDDEFSQEALSLAIIEVGCHCNAGKHGYLQQLANNPEASVARDALKMLEPAHPGGEAAEEDGEAWARYAAARRAWNGLLNAFPEAWLQFYQPTKSQLEARREAALKSEEEAQSPWA